MEYVFLRIVLFGFLVYNEKKRVKNDYRVQHK